MIICQYCSLLLKKLHVHAQHPALEGNHSLDRLQAGHRAQGGVPCGDGQPLSRELLAHELELLHELASELHAMHTSVIISLSMKHNCILDNTSKHRDTLQTFKHEQTIKRLPTVM